MMHKINVQLAWLIGEAGSGDARRLGPTGARKPRSSAAEPAGGLQIIILVGCGVIQLITPQMG